MQRHELVRLWSYGLPKRDDSHRNASGMPSHPSLVPNLSRPAAMFLEHIWHSPGSGGCGENSNVPLRRQQGALTGNTRDENDSRGLLSSIGIGICIMFHIIECKRYRFQGRRVPNPRLLTAKRFYEAGL
jgi:hypothetical protein